jgi:hypothetical protein
VNSLFHRVGKPQNSTPFVMHGSTVELYCCSENGPSLTLFKHVNEKVD